MPRIFLYEFVTGGGFLGDGWGWPPESLLREGAAMADALAADLGATGVEVVALRDCRPKGSGVFFHVGVDVGDREDTSRRHGKRLPTPSRTLSSRVVRSAEEERAAVAELAAACDGTIVIAPELGNALLERCRWVEAAGGRLLGPGPGIVELASDKHATVEHLTAFGVPAPKGWPIEPGGTIPSGAELPAVGKPCLGAGSQGVRLVADREAADAWAAGLEGPGRLERFCPGVAASVAVLCGPAGIFPLVPCRQRLSNDGRFAYQGGSLPLEVSLAQRATDLAVRSVATLPGAMGYLGVDLVLGSNSEGRDDVVIEINPRLTTSYVGLRAAAAADANLAAAILAVCEGRTPRLSFLPIEVQFEPDGSLL
jgi:predicted ATP-grasp superfamily ATP-dependent carboligase